MVAGLPHRADDLGYLFGYSASSPMRAFVRTPSRQEDGTQVSVNPCGRVNLLFLMLTV